MFRFVEIGLIKEVLALEPLEPEPPLVVLPQVLELLPLAQEQELVLVLVLVPLGQVQAQVQELAHQSNQLRPSVR
jgi:hypothetical protein